MQKQSRDDDSKRRSELSQASTQDKSDVLGSYTGTPSSETDDLTPTQDQDDL